MQNLLLEKKIDVWHKNILSIWTRS